MLNFFSPILAFLFQEAERGRFAQMWQGGSQSRPVEVSGDRRAAVHHRRGWRADAAQHHRHLHVDRVDSQCRESELHAFSRYLQETGNVNAVAGQIFTVFVIVVAAAEAAIGLGIVIALYRNKETIWVDEIDLLKW